MKKFPRIKNNKISHSFVIHSFNISSVFFFSYLQLCWLLVVLSGGCTFEKLLKLRQIYMYAV